VEVFEQPRMEICSSNAPGNCGGKQYLPGQIKRQRT
jgi:hypothetical protein